MLDVSVNLTLPTIAIDVDLQIGDEILVLFGPSGAGKTLTIKMIAGLARPDHGRVTIGEQVVFDAATAIDRPPQQRNVGYVPQRSGVFPHLSALDNVSLPLRRGRQRLSRNDADDRSLALLDRFGLRHRAGAFPAQMSGGELQRVALARVMALQPDVLLVDEPFAALDGPVRAGLRQEFREFQRELGVPTIFITHDIEEAAIVGDRIAIMVAGQIRQSGKTREILDAPVDRVVATLVQSENLFDGTVAVRDGMTVIVSPVGPIHVPHCRLEPGRSVTAVVRPEGIRIMREDRGIERFADATMLDATIQDIADHGSLTSVTSSVGGGRITVTLSPTAASNLKLERGKQIRLAIPPEWVHVIPA